MSKLQEKDLIKLDTETWYYMYRNEHEAFFSSVSPIRDSPSNRTSEEALKRPLGKGWYHPQNRSLKCTGFIYVDSSNNIEEYYRETFDKQ
jgi:hypothetical protein